MRRARPRPFKRQHDEDDAPTRTTRDSRDDVELSNAAPAPEVSIGARAKQKRPKVRLWLRARSTNVSASPRLRTGQLFCAGGLVLTLLSEGGKGAAALPPRALPSIGAVDGPGQPIELNVAVRVPASKLAGLWAGPAPDALG